MNLTTPSDATSRVRLPGWRAAAPVAVLVFLAPVLAELLMGGLLLVSRLWLLVPEMAVYGGAALIIRELARRRHRGWGMILLLGLAFAIAEESVILQTSLTPQFFPPAFSATFGWAFGVQWIYLVALLWYESVYAIVLPIYLAELLFPAQRDELWLSRRGLAVAVVLFLLSSAGVSWLWTHHGLPRYGNSGYQIPSVYVDVALLAIAALVAGTLLLQSPPRAVRRPTRRAWPPWLIGVMAFGHGLAWFVLIALAYFPAATFPGVSPLLPIGIGLVWVALALLAVRYLSAGQGWDDRHRLALIFGASLASMLGGVLTILTASRIDQIGKLVLDVIAIILFASLARQLRRRRRTIQDTAVPIHPLMRIPVPWIFIVTYLVGAGLQILVPLTIRSAEILLIGRVAGVVLIVAGAALAAWSLLIFRRLHTTTVPFETPSELVTWGPYRYSRNPMYVSLTLIYLGEAGLLGQIWPLVLLPLTIAYINWIVIPVEERPGCRRSSERRMKPTARECVVGYSAVEYPG